MGVRTTSQHGFPKEWSLRLLHTQTKKVMAEWGFVSPLIAGVNYRSYSYYIGGDKTYLVEEMQAILQAFLDKCPAMYRVYVTFS